jgi:hypothetical protein
VNWTAETETAIGGGQAGLIAYGVKLSEFLQKLVASTHESATFQFPKTAHCLRNLIILEASHLDAVQRLVNAGVTQTSDYLWQRELRAYANGSNVSLAAGTGVIPYQYNYIGNRKFAVQTVETATGYEGIVEGLAGKMIVRIMGRKRTQKEEMVFDLARIAGAGCVKHRQCDAYNRDEFEYQISGFDNTGVWGIFDAVNRITIGV